MSVSKAEVEAAARGIKAAIDEDHELRNMPEADRLKLARASLEAAERVREEASARKLVGLGIEMGIPKHEAEAALGIGPADKGRKAE
jgi:hypothetical protein